jgi:VIT1/CCC1 family predicted Fe2+/Mn2+ transporter
MALGTISTVSIAIGLGPGSRDTLILAAIGVNTTWGLADMIMYMVTKNFDRMRHQKMADAIRGDDDGEFSVEAIEDDLSETIVATLDPVDQRRIYLDVLDSENRAVGRPLRFSAGHFYGGLTCLVLTILAAVPMIMALLLIEPLSLGLRVASLTAMALLFFTGYYWAPYAGLRKWRAGLGTMGAGAVITLATQILGG